MYKRAIRTMAILTGVGVYVAAQSLPTRQTTRFVDEAKTAGYLVQEGKAGVYDFDAKYCAGYIWTADWPNPSSPYISAEMQAPPVQTEPNWVPNTFRLREDEAIVVIGLTPPPAAYFSFNMHMFRGTLRNDVGPPVAWIPVADPINNGMVRTAGPTPFDQTFAFVATGHKRTRTEVHGMLRAAGLQPATNDQVIAPALFRLGLDKDAEQFAFAMRTAVPENQEALDNYLAPLKNDNVPVDQRPIRIFRLRPAMFSRDQIGPVYPSDPLPVTSPRVAGTGTSELDLYPTVQLLRERIIEQNLAAYPGYAVTELEINPLFEQPYPGVQRDKGLLILPPGQLGVAGATSDAVYLGTGDFLLAPGAFLVAYGVHHRATGKASYSSASVYADPQGTVALTTVQSPKLQGSARDYISDQANVEMLYAWTFTRGDSGIGHFSQLMTGDYCQQKFGISRPVPPTTVDLNSLRVIFRAYMEPGSNTHPAEPQLVFDRLLMFTPN